MLTSSIGAKLNLMVLLSVGLKLSIATASIQDVKEMIRAEALNQGVDAELAVAVATVESGLKSSARGSHGEIGVFQLMPYHAPKKCLEKNSCNIHIGVSLLKEMLKKCKDMGEYSVICYNQGPNRRPHFPGRHPYYKKVRLVAYGF